jgi:hypothetical protein
MLTALRTARERRQLGPDADLAAAAELLALLAYGVNLRSRAGAEPSGLRGTVSTALASLGDDTA